MHRLWTARRWVVAVATLGAAFTSGSRVDTRVPVQASARAAQAAASAPVAFEPNVGQFAPEVRFASRGRGYTLLLTDHAAVVTLRPSRAPTAKGATATPEEPVAPAVLRLSLANARGTVSPPAGLSKLPGIVNYLIGDDPRQWHTNIARYARVQYDGVYPGIDLVYYGREGVHEYDFVVAAGADPSLIAFNVDGADRVDLSPEGDLVLATAAGALTMRAPHVFQTIDGERRDVAARFQELEPNTITFALGAYDRDAPIVIDPQIVYGTYLGGGGDAFEATQAVDVDASGAAYVVGGTSGVEYPTRNPLQPLREDDAVITKLTPEGQLVYSTFIGGSRFDTAYDVAVRADGTAYILGATTSSDFPVRNAFQQTYAGNTDAFVVALNREGTAITHATYLGGGDIESPRQIELSLRGDEPVGADAQPNVFGDALFVYGSTTSPNFPLLRPAQDHRVGARDGFVTAFDRQSLTPLFSTYVGLEGTSLATRMALGRVLGHVYFWLERTDERGSVMGRVALTPRGASTRQAGASRPTVLDDYQADVTARAFLEDLADPDKAPTEAMKAFAKEAELHVSEDLGDDVDFLFPGPKPTAGFVRDASPVVLETIRPGATTPGSPRRLAFVVVSGTCLPVAPSTTCSERAAIVFVDADLHAMGHLNFGGTRASREFTPMQLAVDRQGLFHFVGQTNDNTLPLQNSVQGSNHGGGDGFVLTWNPRTRENLFFSYLGGSGYDLPLDIAVDKDGNQWIVGETLSTDFPTTRSGAQPQLNGRIDGFVVKISP